MRRSALGIGSKSLERGTTFASHGNGLNRTAGKRRRVGFTPASDAQRLKIRNAICRECGAADVHPAHVIDRALGGCDDALCVIPLCFRHHREYDGGRFDALSLLSEAEQAHAVSHLGLIGALRRITNRAWMPDERSAG